MDNQETSESHSEEEVEKTEENTELKGLTKETQKLLEESKQLESEDEVDRLTSNYDLEGEPMPGPSVPPCVESSDGSLDQDFNEYYYSAQPQDDGALDTIPTVSRGDSRFLMQIQRFVASRYRRHIECSSSLTTTDSDATASYVPDILTEFVDDSTDESLYHDAPENLYQSPSYTSDFERQGTEGLDTNASDLQEDSFSLSSVSLSTPIGEHVDYLEQLQSEADERGESASWSSGIASTNQSEASNLQLWSLIGEMGGYRNGDNVNYPPNTEAVEHDITIRRPWQPSELNSESQTLKDMGMLYRARTRNDENTESNTSTKDMEEENAASRLLQLDKSDETAGHEMAALHDRQKILALLSCDSSRAEPNGKMSRSGSRPKQAKIVHKSSLPMGFSSESNEPIRSSSDGSWCYETSPGNKSLTDVQDKSSHSESDKKAWQKSVELDDMHHLTTLSKDSVINKEKETVKPLIDETPEIMKVTQDYQSMETSSGNTEDISTIPKLESKSSVQESTSLRNVLHSERSSMEIELSFEAEPERSMGKSKRTEAKLRSTSTDERPSNTCPKTATNRPIKKSKQDKEDSS